MAKFKVVLTAKDRYGFTKELDAGDIEIVQDKLSEEDLTEIKNSLPVYVPTLEDDDKLVYTLGTGEGKEQLEFDLGLPEEVPFADSYRVLNALGGFKAGDDLEDLTVAKIFAKLLGLVPGDEYPEEPENIAVYFFNNKISMYSQDSTGALVEREIGNGSTITTWTVEEAAKPMNGLSTLYQIKDDAGAIIEYGYQVTTDYTKATLTVAIPTDVKAFLVKKFDVVSNKWSDVNFEMQLATEQSINGYNIWVVPKAAYIMPGDTYRFVIS
jgi:hypothetical protein